MSFSRAYQFTLGISQILLCLLFVFSTEMQAKTKVDLVVDKKNSEKLPFYSKEKIQILMHGDEIFRELTWLITKNRPTDQKTPFGKILRSIWQVRKQPLANKFKHECDSYQFENVGPRIHRVYEVCHKNRKPDLIATINWNDSSAEFMFNGQNLSDIIGVAAALVSPEIVCKANWSGRKINKMDCAGLHLNRADMVVRINKFVFDDKEANLMTLEATVLKNLLPYSDLKIYVPQAGVVSITETKKNPDHDEITQEQYNKLMDEQAKKENKTENKPMTGDSDNSNDKNGQNTKSTMVPIMPILSPRELEKQENDKLQSDELKKNAEPELIPIDNTNTR